MKIGTLVKARWVRDLYGVVIEVYSPLHSHSRESSYRIHWISPNNLSDWARNFSQEFEEDLEVLCE
mgnify:FL=1